MHDDPSITITFNLSIRKPVEIFFNAQTDAETAWLQEIIDMMLKALPDREVAPLEDRSGEADK